MCVSDSVGDSLVLAARRITSLSRPGDAAPRAAFAVVNAAGATLQRRSLPDIALPRYGAACPLWSVYRALAEPGRTLRPVPYTHLRSHPTPEHLVCRLLPGIPPS